MTKAFQRLNLNLNHTKPLVTIGPLKAQSIKERQKLKS